ncbi:hypothetical protein [Allosphingosinicella deserti]|uniref:Uncharacterized protein n=1 Tax=Allosphingosinicella deserti TaxID=2116704 RepID=A0A2P7QYU0_9SPHN|nr:hypothetical protein [Sphingomonas deserti]PSJ43125.1 hypothetical protein C7I55_01690 [Sphingomonas deserti]
MNRITSRYLPRAKALVAAFENEGRPTGRAMSPAQEVRRQQSPAGWSVTRAQLARQLNERLNGASLPHQRTTSYCGCAAFLYCLLEDRPDWYVAYATAVWRGEPFNFASPHERVSIVVNATTRDSLRDIQARSGRASRISDLDWMMMASLSAATRRNRAAPSTGATPSDLFSAITWPWMIRRWFASVGASARLDSVGQGLMNGSMEDLLELLDLWGSHWLVMQIDASLLSGGGQSITQRHWVVIDPEMRPLIQAKGRSAMTPGEFARLRRARPFGAGTIPQDAYGAAAAANRQSAEYRAAPTNLRVVSWGNEHTPIWGSTIGNVADRFYGGYAFPRFNR